MQTETPSHYPDDEIDLRQLVATLWDGRWWIIASNASPPPFTGQLPELFEKTWDPVNKRWNVDDPKKEPTLWHGYKTSSENILIVTEEKKTGLATIASTFDA